MKEEIIKKGILLYKKERMTFEKYNKSNEKFLIAKEKMRQNKKRAYEAGEKFIDFLCEYDLKISDFKKFYK